MDSAPTASQAGPSTRTGDTTSSMTAAQTPGASQTVTSTAVNPTITAPPPAMNLATIPQAQVQTTQAVQTTSSLQISTPTLTLPPASTSIMMLLAQTIGNPSVRVFHYLFSELQMLPTFLRALRTRNPPPTPPNAVASNTLLYPPGYFDLHRMPNEIIREIMKQLQSRRVIFLGQKIFPGPLPGTKIIEQRIKNSPPAVTAVSKKFRQYTFEKNTELAFDPSVYIGRTDELFINEPRVWINFDVDLIYLSNLLYDPEHRLFLFSSEPFENPILNAIAIDIPLEENRATYHELIYNLLGSHFPFGLRGEVEILELEDDEESRRAGNAVDGSVEECWGAVEDRPVWISTLERVPMPNIEVVGLTKGGVRF